MRNKTIIPNWTGKALSDTHFICKGTNPNQKYRVIVLHPKGSSYIGGYNQRPKALVARNAAVLALNSVFKRKPYKSR